MPSEIRKRLANPILALANNPRPAGVRKLKGDEQSWRVMVGPYRIVYDIFDDRKLVVVLKVARRSETTYKR